MSNFVLYDGIRTSSEVVVHIGMHQTRTMTIPNGGSVLVGFHAISVGGMCVPTRSRSCEVNHSGWIRVGHHMDQSAKRCVRRRTMTVSHCDIFDSGKYSIHGCLAAKFISAGLMKRPRMTGCDEARTRRAVDHRETQTLNGHKAIITHGSGELIDIKPLSHHPRSLRSNIQPDFSLGVSPSVLKSCPAPSCGQQNIPRKGNKKMHDKTKGKCSGEYRYIINATPRGTDRHNPDWGASIKPSPSTNQKPTPLLRGFPDSYAKNTICKNGGWMLVLNRLSQGSLSDSTAVQSGIK